MVTCSAEKKTLLAVKVRHVRGGNVVKGTHHNVVHVLWTRYLSTHAPPHLQVPDHRGEQPLEERVLLQVGGVTIIAAATAAALLVEALLEDLRLDELRALDGEFLALLGLEVDTEGLGCENGETFL